MEDEFRTESPLIGTEDSDIAVALTQTPVTLEEAFVEGTLAKVWQVSYFNRNGDDGQASDGEDDDDGSSGEAQILTAIVRWRGVNYAVQSNLPEPGFMKVGLVGTLNPRGNEYLCEVAVRTSKTKGHATVASVICGQLGGGFPIVELSVRILRLVDITNINLVDISRATQSGVGTVISNTLCKKEDRSWWDKTMDKLMALGLVESWVSNKMMRDWALTDWKKWGAGKPNAETLAAVAASFPSTVTAIENGQKTLDTVDRAALFCALMGTNCHASVIHHVFSLDDDPIPTFIPIAQEILAKLTAPQLKAKTRANGTLQPIDASPRKRRKD